MSNKTNPKMELESQLESLSELLMVSNTVST